MKRGSISGAVSENRPPPPQEASPMRPMPSISRFLIFISLDQGVTGITRTFRYSIVPGIVAWEF